MKVKGNTRDTIFRDIVCGRAFIFEGKTYMRTHRIDPDDVDGGLEPINAVHLESGHFRHVPMSSKVISKPNATIDLGK